MYCAPTSEIVVFHDELVDKLTNGRGFIEDFTYIDLRSLRIKPIDGEPEQQIPTLKEVFDFINRRVQINIELKGPRTEDRVVRLIEEYVRHRGWSEDDFLISSFDHYRVKRVRELSPRFKTGALMSGNPIGLAKYAEDLGCYFAGQDAAIVRKEFVDDAHQRWLKVFCWTVNDPLKFKQLEAMGVDGVFTNFPDRF